MDHLNCPIITEVTCRVRKYRNESDNVLYLNAGDTYTGTPWFSLFTSNITTEMMNILQPDAIVRTFVSL